MKEYVENETKDKKFVRIATKRANRILDDLRLLGNCSNRSVYAYNESQVSHIFGSIEQELKRVKALFGNGTKRKIVL